MHDTSQYYGTTGESPGGLFWSCRVWRVHGEWRLRLVRRRGHPVPFIEVSSSSFWVCLDVLGIGAGWWTP